MSNRFTNELLQLRVVDLNHSTERFDWANLSEIDRYVWVCMYDFDNWSIDLDTEFIDRLSERWILLGFIAAMSDADIDELIINWQE